MTHTFANHSLSLGGVSVLEGISDDLQVEPGAHGVFLHFRAPESASRFRVRLGSVPALDRYVVCHRFDPYWMKPAVGRRVGEVPTETQFFLGQLGSVGWLLIVPLLSDPLRFSLQAGEDDSLELLGETGCARLPARTGLAAYVAVAQDPFSMMREGAQEVATQLGIGKLRREKPLPDFIDQFGWCTWDAFYAAVGAADVRAGLEAFAAGGVQPKMLILDDGWLDVQRMPTGEKRLVSFDANAKFDGGLARFVEMAKGEFGIKTLLVWHTIVGYWGGVSTDLGYDAVDQVRHFGEGILAHVPNSNNEWWGELVGLVPEHAVGRFFDEFHSYLREQGVDGVKVDSQAVLEALSQGQGGRVRLSRVYRQALEASVSTHFDGRLINCMSNAQETWYGSSASTLIRSSIDYFPTRAESHGLHVYTNAMVGLWFGQFMHPDWDMFQSTHPLGAFHAAARAISGGPVYVSDRPGEHDFGLLRKLVSSDGGVLRADQPALPTIDSLLVDPARDEALFKIWNRNGVAAIVGAFNCNTDPAAPNVLHGDVGPRDVPEFAGERFVIYAHCAKTLEVIECGGRVRVALPRGGFELFTLVPIEHDFAAIGLVDMFNSRAAVLAESRLGDGALVLTLRDGGRFVAYARQAPRALRVDEREAPFAYDAVSRKLEVSVGIDGPVELAIVW